MKDKAVCCFICAKIRFFLFDWSHVSPAVTYGELQQMQSVNHGVSDGKREMLRNTYINIRLMGHTDRTANRTNVGMHV
jgi:hypothetical protein